MLDRLLGQLRQVVEFACWGRPLGSTILWEQHLNTINRIHEIADRIEIRPVIFILTNVQNFFLMLNCIFSLVIIKNLNLSNYLKSVYVKYC
jgi:hypothetical protein